MDNIIGCWVLVSIKKGNGHPGYFQINVYGWAWNPFCGRYCWLACPALNLNFFSLFNSNYRNWKSKILAFPATLVLRVALWLIRAKRHLVGSLLVPLFLLIEWGPVSWGCGSYLMDYDGKRMNQTTVITSLSHWIHATNHLPSNLLSNNNFPFI